MTYGISDDQAILNSVETPSPRWALIEIVGHARVSGRVQDISRFGQRGALVEVPTADESVFGEQFVPGRSIHRVTYQSEADSREENGLWTPSSPDPRGLAPLDQPQTREDTKHPGCQSLHDGCDWPDCPCDTHSVETP